MVNNALWNKARVAHGLPEEKVTYNMLVTGNPGTGKTMATEKLGELFHALGVVKKPGVAHLQRSDLTGEFVNTAAEETRKAIQANKGRVIFIDEAYSLYTGPGDKEGRQVIDELMRLAEENRDDTVIVMAGYGEEMDRMFEVNPGLKSRFPRRLDLPDYSPKDKGAVLEYMVESEQNRFGSNSAAKAARDYVGVMPTSADSGNARAVRNFKDRMVEARSARLLDTLHSEDKSITLTQDDFATFTRDDVETAAAELGLPKPRRNKAVPRKKAAQAGYAKRVAPKVRPLASENELVAGV